MTEPLGYGPCGSMSGRVDREIRDLSRDNPALRRARYKLPRRLLRAALVNRSISQFLGLYFVVVLAALVCEWAVNRYASGSLPGYYGAIPRDFLRDVGSYLITAQIGILAIVSVAVGVVTLLSERGDGSSVNTDVRLYYFESYSYELAVSGVALLLVLTVQLFWPFQHFLHVAGLGGTDYSFKLGLSALHTLWFCLNLLLFLQFITTTLRFVEPSSREGLRERYSANEIISRDARTRLLRALFINAPNQIFGEQVLREGPAITFGYRSSLDDRAVTEATKAFRSPVKLQDVRLKPLSWVLRRWQRRVRRGGQRPGPFGQPLWDDHLTIPLGFDDTYEGATDLAIRRGQVPLYRIEQWIVRRCFRFRPDSPRDDDLPTPNDFLEQLVDKLVRQAEQNATTGFRAALDETIRFHNAAYFFASAVWNDDALGADRLRDMLLRWLNPFYGNPRANYGFSNTILLTPDLLSQPWTTASTEVTQRMRFRHEAAVPRPIFGILLWELHSDVVCISGLIALHWYATGEQPSEIASQAALLTLRRVARTGDGSDLTNVTQKSVFRLLFDFAVRYALNPRFAEGRYSATIDSLVGFLTDLSSPRMVSGRIYSGIAIGGFETLRPVLLAALAANLPTQGDGGIGTLTGALKNDPLFADDKRIRDFIWTSRP